MPIIMQIANIPTKTPMNVPTPCPSPCNGTEEEHWGQSWIFGVRGPAMPAHVCLDSKNMQAAGFLSVAFVCIKNGTCINSAIASQSWIVYGP